MKIILTGGPNTGKTTILNEMRKKYFNLSYVIEPAAEIIRLEKNKESYLENYKGIFPWSKYDEFKVIVVEKSLELEQNILTPDAILDRSLVDNVGYARAFGTESTLPAELEEHIKNAEYTMVFFCEFVGEYQKNEVRSESIELAQKIHEALRQTYEEYSKKYSYKIVTLPAMPLEERINFINENILQFTESLKLTAPTKPLVLN